MNGLADQDDVRLRFDVLTKTKQPELHRYWTTRDRAANVRLFRLAAEVLRAIEAGVFHPGGGGPWKEGSVRRPGWGGGEGGPGPKRFRGPGGRGRLPAPCRSRPALAPWPRRAPGA